QIAELQSKHMKIVGSDDFKATNRMNKVLDTRRGFVDYYTHKASKMIIDIANDHQVGTIVIGDFKGIKKENKIKYFVQIPHTRLINQIKYKAAKHGIKVVMMNEAYTSSVSAVDLEMVEKEAADKSR
ncbi:IS200/IS605 family element transposase accessory protein TnpB, partial [Acidaminobacter sp. JC074]|uniref:IS200/IS605 family accessory protein TnpB-related protein n=1 Tax=Acidaminobacter sp. JC074 TaxID=2530199 RepID=UPI001F1104D7